MPDHRTLATELGTALGMLGFDTPAVAIAARPGALHLTDETWEQLDEAADSARHQADLARAFANGEAFLTADSGLRGRRPELIEWTGGRRPPGDEVAPIDLRIDHVFLVSCKYESDILANASPARVFEGLLATSGSWDRRDWYASVATTQLNALYRACRAATALHALPDTPSACMAEQLAELRAALPRGGTYPDASSRQAYAELCRVVSDASAQRWRAQLATSGLPPETMLWRLLRIGSAPYFVLGHDRSGGRPARYRIASPWDWREEFRLVEFTVRAAQAGQPRVDWSALVRHRAGGAEQRVAGHVEVRWSHGRFAQPPEAKVYLDTPMADLPGYHPLVPDAQEPTRGACDEGQLTLWSDR